jgi:hypothetical protein
MHSAEWQQAGWQAVATHWTGNELVATYMPSPPAAPIQQVVALPQWPGGSQSQAQVMGGIGPEQRHAILAGEVARAIANGGRVQSQDAYQAVVVFGKPVNHILHALLSIFLLGLWLIVWLIVGLTGGEKRELIAVDESGQVFRRRV